MTARPRASPGPQSGFAGVAISERRQAGLLAKAALRPHVVNVRLARLTKIVQSHA
jgi:hypothetical protein